LASDKGNDGSDDELQRDHSAFFDKTGEDISVINARQTSLMGLNDPDNDQKVLEQINKEPQPSIVKN